MKYNFALKVNSILLTKERNECLKSSFIRIPTRCTSNDTQGSDHQGELASPSQSPPSSPPAWRASISSSVRKHSTRDEKCLALNLNLRQFSWPWARVSPLLVKCKWCFPVFWDGIVGIYFTYFNKCTKTVAKKGWILVLGQKAESPQQAEYDQEELFWASLLLIKSLTLSKHPLSIQQLGIWFKVDDVSTAAKWMVTRKPHNPLSKEIFPNPCVSAERPTQSGRSAVGDIRLTWEDLSLCLIAQVWSKSELRELLVQCCSWSLLHISSQFQSHISPHFSPSLGVQYVDSCPSSIY